MRCAVDSGLCVVLIILSALMFAVGVLLFYDFENVCENGNSNITNMVNEHEPIGGFVFDVKLRSFIYFLSACPDLSKPPLPLRLTMI